MERAVSISDVAKKAGVSTKTVSRVINNEPNVTERTKSRVQEAIDALAYTPSVSARILASNKSYAIHLLCRTPQSDYFAGIQFAALSVCQSLGYRLAVSLLEDYHELKPAALKTRLQALIKRPFPDGVLLTPPFCDDKTVLQYLQDNHIPFVKISPKQTNNAAPCVSFNEQQAAFDLTQHLIDLGHRRIAFIKGNPSHGAATARAKGYYQALEKNNIEADPDIVLQGDFHFPSGLTAGNQLLSMKKPPSAIFASNDEMAAGASIAAHRLGLEIPDDVSIVGFDDSSIAQLTWPSLTTIRQPLHELSSAATNLLINPQNGEEKSADGAPSIVLDYALIERESSGPHKP